MIGIIAGEVMGSPYRKKNLDGLHASFVPFEDNHDIVIEGHRGSSSVRERVYRAEPGRITDAVLNGSRAETLDRVDRGDTGSALACAILLGGTDAAMGLSESDHGASVRNYLSSFPEGLRPSMERLADAAYSLRSGGRRDICLATGYTPPPDCEFDLMGSLRGQFVVADGGEMVMGDGAFSDDRVIDAATWAIRTSYSFREAVEKAVKLGGNSDIVGAVTGGLAELVFGTDDESFRRDILLPLEERLGDDRKAALREYGERVRLYSRAVSEGGRPVRDSAVEEVEIMSFPRGGSDTGSDTVYCVPEGRDDILAAVLLLKENPAVMNPQQFASLRRELAEREEAVRARRGGAYIPSPRPEERVLYYSRTDGRIHTPITLSSSDAFGLHMAGDIERMRNRTAFEDFRSRCAAIRDEQERKAGHDPSLGHLAFESAWWLRIERDRVTLMKGGEPMGEFGIDKRGNLRVNTNVIGGVLAGGGRLETALDNLRVFARNDGAAEVISRLREKCLDEGRSADEALLSEERPVYDRPEGEERVRTNAELMDRDLSSVRGDLPAEPAVMSFSELGQYVREGRRVAPARTGYMEDGEVATIDRRIASTANRGAVFTVGHSNLGLSEFIANLRLHGIDTVRDVRSVPFSRNSPHFNRDALAEALAGEGIRYVYDGEVMGGSVRRWQALLSGEDIRFTRSQGGYRERTVENAKSADLTVAFAADFGTAGERLTAEAARGRYLSYQVEPAFSPRQAAEELVSLMSADELSRMLRLNIAGNGMETFARHGFSQNDINGLITCTLGHMLELGVNIGSIVSGGQTGADEAGIIAAMELGIPAEVHGTRHWAMRGADGVDVFGEHDFKLRFARGVRDGEDPCGVIPYREQMRSKGFSDTLGEIILDARRGSRQALMCAETRPQDCHRYACLGYALSHPEAAGRRLSPVPVQHILRDGRLVPQAALEAALCRRAGLEYTADNLAPLMERESDRLHAPREDRRLFAKPDRRPSSAEVHRRR